MAVLEKPQFGDSPATPKRGVSVTPMAARRGVTQPDDRHQTRTARRPFLLEGDVLLVTNEDDVTWRFGWNRQSYLLAPGESKVVPFPALVNAMGDPRSVKGEMIHYNAETGERGVVSTRYDTLAYLFGIYGIEGESMEALVERAPKISAQTMTGEHVVFPVQNPDMAPWPVPQIPEPGREQAVDQKALIEQVAQENAAMRAELARLRGTVEERLGGHVSDGETDDAVPVGSGALPDTGPRQRI